MPVIRGCCARARLSDIQRMERLVFVCMWEGGGGSNDSVSELEINFP